MLEPNGPLPPEVYWRRRMLAIGGLLVAIVLTVWLIVSVSGGDDTAKKSSAPNGVSSSSATTTADTSDAETTSDSAGSTSDSPSSSAATSAVAAGQCPDQSLAIKVGVAQPTYQVGQSPVFQLVITNISTGSCQRDLGPALQQVMVSSLDGQQRVWANTDCFSGNTPDMRDLGPGQQAAFNVTWSGTTSQPGCTSARVPVKPGAYQVVAQLGALRSAPEPFNIAP